MYISVCPKNSSQTVNGSDLKFAHVIPCAIPRSTVPFLGQLCHFSVFKLQCFSNSHLFLNRTRVLNSRATGSKKHCASVRSNANDFASSDGSTGSSPVSGALSNHPEGRR